MKKLFLAGMLIIGTISNATADISNTLATLLGYQVVASKTIVSYRDQDGTRKDEFDGCQYGRVIIFLDNTYLTCMEYSYS